MKDSKSLFKTLSILGIGLCAACSYYFKKKKVPACGIDCASKEEHKAAKAKH